MQYSTDYLNESQLRTLTKLAVTFATFATLLLIIFNPLVISAQQPSELSQRGFEQALAAIQVAESAGATTSEVSPLVTMLNNALQLDHEALNLTPPEEGGRRTQLLAQVNQTITTVQNQANELSVVASHRNYMKKVIAYVAGVIVAALGTIVYGFAAAFYQDYRIKRIFQMEVKPK
jgi:hypothetical protein